MPWEPSANAQIDHTWEFISDELIMPDGAFVGTLQCFETNDDIYYVNVIDTAGKAHRAVMSDYGEARKWAEETAGLRPRLSEKHGVGEK
jgi:hypothetical protein